MKVLITGGAGFLGRRLAKRLLQIGRLRNAEGVDEAIDELVLFDVVAADGFNDPRVRVITGNLADPAAIDRLIDAQTASIFHLAAIVSSQAEADFDLGMRINVDALRQLFETCRSRGNRPKVVFASSVAVYGGDLPAVVTDATALDPQSSYGIQKLIGELLLKDFSRKGYIDGRGVRLPTISVRPGKPNQAASSFASSLIREPLQGQPALCPVTTDTRLWLLSPRQAIECLICAHDLDAADYPSQRVVNLPGVSVTVAEMFATLERVAGPEAVARITLRSDAVVQRIVGSWPGAWDASRAHTLGFKGDEDFESIVRAFIADDLSPAPAE